MHPADRATGTVVEDLFSDLEDDTTIVIHPQVFGGSNVGAVPTVVENWDFFDGAVGAVAILTESAIEVEGTAALIAPGLAVSATHVIAHALDELKAGDRVGLLVAPRIGGRLDVWKIEGVTRSDNDITFLSIRLRSAIHDDWTLRVLPCTTVIPTIGQALHIIGFRVEREDASRGNMQISMRGDLYNSAGIAQQLLEDGLGSMIPWRVLEITCGALGGNSGGPVIDASGRLVGVVSASLGHEDGKGPTHASLLVDALDEFVVLGWPSGLTDHAIRVRDIPDGALFLEGRQVAP